MKIHGLEYFPNIEEHTLEVEDIKQREAKVIMVDGEIVSVVSKGYNIIENKEVVDCIDEIATENGITLKLQENLCYGERQWNKCYNRMVFTSVENEIAVAEDDSKYEFSFGFTNGFDGRTSLKFDYTSINYKGVLNFYAYRQVCSNGMMGWKKLEDLKNLREGEEFKTKWEREILKRKIERFSFRHNMNNLIGRVEIAFKEAMRNNEMTADFLSLIYKQTYQKELVDKFLEKIRKGDQEVVGDILIASNNMHEFINHITAMESHIPQFKDQGFFQKALNTIEEFEYERF